MNVVKATVKDGVIGSETQPDNMMGSAPRQGDFKANLDFLIVVQPKNLDEQTKFAIDQYVMKGGKLIIFEDPFCYFDRPPRDNPYGAEGFSQASDLNDLTAKWGLSMRPSTLAIDRSLALLRDNQGEPIISALVLDDHCTATGEPITANLRTVTVLAAGVLDQTNAAANVHPLLQTTAGAGTFSPSGPLTAETVMAGITPTTVISAEKPLWLAGIIRGRMLTNFPTGLALQPPAEEPKDPAAPKPASQPATKPARHLDAIQQSSPDAAVVVVADADLLADPLSYEQTIFGSQPRGDNSSLLLNAVDFLSGQQDLISIRSRGRYSRPFKVVDDKERAAVAEGAEKIKEAQAKIDKCTAEFQKLGEDTNGKSAKLVNNEQVAKVEEIKAEMKAAERDSGRSRPSADRVSRRWGGGCGRGIWRVRRRRFC